MNHNDNDGDDDDDGKHSSNSVSAKLICRWHILDEFWYDALHITDYLMIANNARHDKNENQTEEMVCKRYVNKIGISIWLKDYSVY